MELLVQLRNSYGRLASREPFIITSDREEAYYLNLDSDVVIKRCAVIWKRGETTREDRYFDATGEIKRIRIPDDFILEGELEIDIRVIKSGVTVAKFHVEPIVFARVDTEFNGHPEIEDLRSKVAEQESKIQALETIIEGLRARIDVAEQKVDEIWNNEEM